MNKAKAILFFILLILLLPYEGNAQDRIRFCLNGGYVTNFKKCPECTKADTGDSTRAGVLTRGRFGFYAGCLWFNEHHPDYIEYEDKGSFIMAGTDFRILRKGDFEWYVKAGIGITL